MSYLGEKEFSVMFLVVALLLKFVIQLCFPTNVSICKFLVDLPKDFLQFLGITLNFVFVHVSL